MGKKKGLTNKEELFCRFYARSGSAFGNATLSYSLAFDKPMGTKKQYAVCSELGSRLLRKVEIHERCDELLAEVIDERVVDGELAKVIKQNGSLGAKVGAINEYNKVRGRHKERHTHDFEGVSTEELAESLAELLAEVIAPHGGTEGKRKRKPRAKVRS